MTMCKPHRLTAESARRGVSGGEGKETKSRVVFFFLLFVWCCFLPYTTKELRKLLIIYCTRLAGEWFAIDSPRLGEISTRTKAEVIRRKLEPSQTDSQSSTAADCCCLKFTTSFLFLPKQKKYKTKFLLSQFSSHTETRFSFSYFVQSCAVDGTDNVALRFKRFKWNFFLYFCCCLLINVFSSSL